MRREPRKSPRTKNIPIRFTEEEWRLLELAARRLKYSDRCDLIRDRLATTIQRQREIEACKPPT